MPCRRRADKGVGLLDHGFDLTASHSQPASEPEIERFPIQVDSVTDRLEAECCALCHIRLTMIHDLEYLSKVLKTAPHVRQIAKVVFSLVAVNVRRSELGEHSGRQALIVVCVSDVGCQV